jgi:hypothetical protein
LSANAVLNRTKINYIKREIGYYIIIILNIIKIKLNIDAADCQDCSSLGNMGGWGEYSTKTARYNLSEYW